MIVVSDRNSWAFNRSWANLAVARDIFKALMGCGMLVFFTNSNVTEFQVCYLALLCFFSGIGGFK